MGLAYTTITDEKIPIQVNADLVNFRIERYLNGEFLERRQYKSLEELIQNELEELVFDNLISASEEELESIHIFNGDPASQENYRLLSRLKADCDYFLGAGKRAEKHLWSGYVRTHLDKMRELYAALPEKPEWLAPEDIGRYDRLMAPPYQVVVYPNEEKGFVDKQRYQTLAEAEQAAQKYVDGVMEGESDFAYEGAAVYDIHEKQMAVRFSGTSPINMQSSKLHRLSPQRNRQNYNL